MTKLINVASAARVLIAAMIFVVAGSANAQIGSVQEGRGLAREVCAECHAIDNAASGSANPNAPTFKVIANTPGTSFSRPVQTNEGMMWNVFVKRGTGARLSLRLTPAAAELRSIQYEQSSRTLLNKLNDTLAVIGAAPFLPVLVEGEHFDLAF